MIEAFCDGVRVDCGREVYHAMRTWPGERHSFLFVRPALRCLGDEMEDDGELVRCVEYVPEKRVRYDIDESHINAVYSRERGILETIEENRMATVTRVWFDLLHHAKRDLAPGH